MDWHGVILVKRDARNSYTAGWSSPVARRAHNPKVAGPNPAPATTKTKGFKVLILKPFAVSTLTLPDFYNEATKMSPTSIGGGYRIGFQAVNISGLSCKS